MVNGQWETADDEERNYSALTINHQPFFINLLLNRKVRGICLDFDKKGTKQTRKSL